MWVKLFLCLLFVNLYSGLKLMTKQTNTFQVMKAIRARQVLYTQGLFFSDDGKYLYQSSGEYGKSRLVRLEYPSLNQVQSFRIGSSYFAEGIASCGNFLYMLTWKERTIFKFSYPSLRYLGTIRMDSNLQEGWGLTSYGEDQLIASDGTSNLYFLDCNNNLRVTRILPVRSSSGLLSNINELEYANGLIWANVYFNNNIYAISPITGNVTRIYNMSSLINNEIRQGTLTSFGLNTGLVLNGIAYNKQDGTFLLTGKNWGYYYQVRFN